MKEDGIDSASLKGRRDDSFKEDLFARRLERISTGEVTCAHKDE